MTTPVSYNIDDAAAAVGVSKFTLWGEIRAGRLTAHYPTSRPLILASELERWVQSASTTGRGTKGGRRPRRSA